MRVCIGDEVRVVDIDGSLWCGRVLRVLDYGYCKVSINRDWSPVIIVECSACFAPTDCKGPILRLQQLLDAIESTIEYLEAEQAEAENSENCP